MQKIVTSSVEETKNFAEEFAKTLNKGDVLCFYGDLGSGKTSFVQGLAKGLGIERRIISPTFIIVRSYDIDKGAFYHIDLYRTESKNDLISLGIDQLLESKDNILAIEWAEKLKDLKPNRRIDLRFRELSENSREITIEKNE
jgi:tRNA threonylcarbamoyladenosine biosynthesis protein TsaE